MAVLPSRLCKAVRMAKHVIASLREYSGSNVIVYSPTIARVGETISLLKATPQSVWRALSNAEEFGDWWPQQRPFTMRYLDAPPRVALDLSDTPPPRQRIWLRANGQVSDDPMVNSCVVAYLSALTLLECAMTTMHTTPMGPRLSALVDHTVWFHRAADFTDWLLFDQSSPSVVGRRGLATGTLYNRSGELVCIATQEGYFAEQRQ